MWPFLLRYTPSISNFLRCITVIGYWILSNAFLCIDWDGHLNVILHFFNAVYHSFNLCMLNHPCIPGINPTWSWCMVCLVCCWIVYFVEDVFFYVHQWYWSVVLFSCNILIWVWYQDNVGLVKWIEECSLLFTVLGTDWEGLVLILI